MWNGVDAFVVYVWCVSVHSVCVISVVCVCIYVNLWLLCGMCLWGEYFKYTVILWGISGVFVVFLCGVTVLYLRCALVCVCDICVLDMW